MSWRWTIVPAATSFVWGLLWLGNALATLKKWLYWSFVIITFKFQNSGFFLCSDGRVTPHITKDLGLSSLAMIWEMICISDLHIQELRQSLESIRNVSGVRWHQRHSVLAVLESFWSLLSCLETRWVRQSYVMSLDYTRVVSCDSQGVMDKNVTIYCWVV